MAKDKKRKTYADQMLRKQKTTLTPEQKAEIEAAFRQVAFSPGDEPLDLTKAEKIRSTALLMAIDYVDKTICNDAEMYRALRQDGKHLVPATTPHVLRSALKFEQFLLGRYTEVEAQIRDERTESTPKVDAVDPSGGEQESSTARD